MLASSATTDHIRARNKTSTSSPVQFRNIPDNAPPLEHIASLKKLASLDWDRMIPGHPYAGGRLGTKKDVEDDIAYMEDLSAEGKKAADAGKCFDTAMKEVKLPKYEKWANYEASPSATDGRGTGAMMTSCSCFARRVKSNSLIQNIICAEVKPLISLPSATVHGVVFEKS